MEKRVVLAVVLTIAVIYLTNLLFPPLPAPETTTEQGGAADSVTAMEAPGAAEDSAAPGSDTAPPGVAGADLPSGGEERPAGDTVVVRSGLYELRFSSVGAALIGARLLEYESFAMDANGDDRVRLVRAGDAVLGYRIAAAGDTADLSVRTFTTSRTRVDVAPGSTGDSLRFTYDFPGGSVRYVVTYRFRPDDYLIDVEGRLEGLGDRGWSVITSLGTGLPTNEKNPEDDFQQLAFVTNGQASGIESVQFDKLDRGEIHTASGGPFGWVAVKNKYFLIALVAPEEGPRFGGLVARAGAEEHRAALVTSMPVPAGSEGFSFQAYVGPQKYDQLEAVGQNLEGVNPYGWRWLRPIIRPLVGIVMLILTWLHETLSLAYGWVLIVFGVMMRVVLFPLYQKSMRAQLAQMQVQPLMKAIQEQHKDDPQRLQQEMMKLYREHNINPVAGCLPVLLPMPILFTLFFVFQGTIEFRGVPFFWLPDLSLKDPLYIIPLLMGVSMFLLSWIGQKGMEQTNPQMKMMTYVLPVVFTVMFASFPSGLNLYYTTSNIASLPQQFYLSHERKAAMAKRAPVPPPEKRDGGRGRSRKRD